MEYETSRGHTIEMDVFVPLVNPYRRTPTEEQLRYARDLAESELPFPERTIDRFPTMSRFEIGNLITSLQLMRRMRLKRLKTGRRAA